MPIRISSVNLAYTLTSINKTCHNSKRMPTWKAMFR